jgi:LPXTG-motif cell wall-anchored protein
VRKIEKTKPLLTFAVLTALLLTSAAASQVSAASSTSFNLAQETNQIQYKIPSGTQFNGSIATSGMVRFWVTAPGGAEVVNLGIVDKTTPFSFVAQQNGTYTFNFENDMPNTITVTFSYTTNPQLPETSTVPNMTYILIGVVAVAVAGSLIIIFAVRRKNKKVATLQDKQLSPHDQAKQKF